MPIFQLHSSDQATRRRKPRGRDPGRRREHVGQLAEHVANGGASDPGGRRQRRPAGHGRAQQPELARVEPWLAVAARDLAQPAVEVVRPGVVRALQRRAAPGAVEHVVAAVAADVDERAERPVAAADDRERDRARAARCNEPGAATWSARPAYCQLRRKIELRSRASVSGVGVPAGGEGVACVEAAATGSSSGSCSDGHPPSSKNSTIRRLVRNTPRWPQSSPISSIREKSSLWLSSNVVQASA